MSAQLDYATKLKRVGVREQYLNQYVFLWTAGVLVFMCMGIASPQFSVRMIEKGVSLQNYGTIQAMAILLSICTQVGIGKLSDRLGQRKLLIVGALTLLVPVIAIFPYASRPVEFFILLSLSQMAMNTFQAMSVAWVTGWGIENRMGRLHGYFRIAFSIGWVIATLFIGFLLDSFGFTTSFLIASSIVIMAVVLVAAGTKGKDEALVQYRSVGTVCTDFRWPIRLKILFLALGVFVFAQTMGMHLNFIFFSADMGVSNQQFGWLTSVQSWPEIPLMLFLGIASDRLSTGNLLSIGMVLGGLRWLLMSVVYSVPLLFLIQPLHAIGMTVTEVVIVAVVARMVPKTYLGTVMAWKVTVMNVARFLAPLSAGYISQNLGIRFVFTLSGITAILAGLIVLRIARAAE